MGTPSEPVDGCQPQPAAETYRDYVIIVLPASDASGQWRCTCLIESFSDEEGRWTYEAPGPYPDRSSAYRDAIARGKRGIDRLLAQIGL